jgi:capsular exopolysaccharide synthesis family protein
MEIQAYFAILWRRKILIALCCLVPAIWTYQQQVSSPDVYSAVTSVLLKPGDPSEVLPGTDIQYVFPERYLEAQLTVITSNETAARAAAALGEPYTADDIRSRVSASGLGLTDIIDIRAVDADPEVAAKVSQAVADAFIENRRLSSVSSLERASDEIEIKLEALQQQISDLDTKLAGVADDSPDKTVLSSERDAAVRQYSSLFNTKQEIDVQVTLKRGEAEIVERAQPSTAPVPQPAKSEAAKAGALGLFVGLVAAFALALIGNRVNTRKELVELSRKTPIAAFPFDPRAARGRTLAVGRKDGGSTAEAAFRLRTALLVTRGPQALRRIVVTGPGAGEGKSLVSVNLSAAFARSGKRTVLVSADLRRPSVDKVFGYTSADRGLSDLVLALSSVAPEDRHDGEPMLVDMTGYLCETSVENLYLLPSGTEVSVPTEALASTACAEVLDWLGQNFDVVLIDTAGAARFSDATVLALKADVTLVVAALGRCRRNEMRTTLEALASDGEVEIVENFSEEAGGKRGLFRLFRNPSEWWLRLRLLARR